MPLRQCKVHAFHCFSVMAERGWAEGGVKGGMKGGVKGEEGCQKLIQKRCLFITSTFFA